MPLQNFKITLKFKILLLKFISFYEIFPQKLNFTFCSSTLNCLVIFLIQLIELFIGETNNLFGNHAYVFIFPLEINGFPWFWYIVYMNICFPLVGVNN
jgi:hypothetical protein